MTIICNKHPAKMKPAGLWLGPDGPNSWESWCRGANFCLGGLVHKHRVSLTPGANILHIATLAEFDKFCEQYERQTWLERGILACSHIDWDKIESEYQGILIAPYREERHLEGPIWYYSWDCASGCVWDADAIASIDLVSSEPCLTITEPSAWEGIKAFLSGRVRRTWVNAPDIKVYLRRSVRIDPFTKDPTAALDIASVEAKYPSQGAFTKLLGDITLLAIAYNIPALYVENVLDERFANYFRRLGWLEDSNSSPMSPSFFYRLPTPKGKMYALAD